MITRFFFVRTGAEWVHFLAFISQDSSIKTNLGLACVFDLKLFLFRHITLWFYSFRL